ncbi:MAU2 chromatid cohesion factor homolog [Macrosteles quadrilineatus]|uniref:MAU2 chromatid cohesion factor homolog n=1 Tax=Macrosteles quadrilineatus TaxID=74068 RepID=UPI0023E27D96|nr:MAU2 chromatid cohesion factor homolog [Macrosteles quadrilineatus]XP_054286576.1 MAU2 chromatid cohesion factor homolog [Macrosteles quadrilineatus]
MASSQDAWYLSLLGLAENFRTSSPPNIKLCIQCLQAVFHFKPPPRVEARTHLQLGNILLTHTKNVDLARSHLEQAWLLSQIINAFDDVKFEAASVLAELYEQQNQSNLSKPILRKAIELSQHSIYWHCRLIFQLAQIHATEKDYELASSLLGVGVDYAHISQAHYTRVLFLLSRCMLMLIDKKFLEVLPLLNQAGHLVDNWTGNQHQKEYLKVYFLVLQVCHYLMAGQVKSVKPCLKQLQQSIQTIMMPSWPTDDVVSGANPGDMFIWMPKEHLYVLVYLVTVMHSMQAGYMDKAQKYTEKALMQIEKLKIVDNKPILSVFQLMLLEHIVMCRLVMGNKTLALQEMAQACSLCESQPKLLQSHRPQLHTLLGLYAMSMNCMEAAEGQFMAALRLSQERDLWTFANLNLGIVYLRGKREMEFSNLLERINPETLPSHSHSLRAAAYYVQGLQSFFLARYNEAKRYLRETLKMANAEDSNRLTSCTLVLLGHIFLSLGNSQESMNMVTPAMQLASKIPDVHVQLWASAILKDLYRMCGDPVRENEAYQMHCNFSQMLLKDHFQSSQMAEHNLIFWLEGSFPLLATNPPSTSTQLGI